MIKASGKEFQPAYRRIERELRESILSGKLAYGARLPSVYSLAEKYGTSVFTIQNALAPLVQDGLLESTRRRGTFVRCRPNELRSVGVYFGRDFWAGPEMAFYRELDRWLSREFAADKVRKTLWIDSRKDSMQTEPLPDLLSAVKKGEIQGLIVASVNSTDVVWLQELGIPLAMLSSYPVPFRVGYESESMMKQSIIELKRLGCRTAGLICSRPADAHSEDVLAMFRGFVDAGADAGLEIRNEWIRTPVREMADKDFQHFGYRAFQEIWSLPQRPDGLVVHPDTIVIGVITAVLQLGVRTPDELKLVLHRNEGIDILCPFPASWLVASVRQTALALIEQLQRQISGKSVSPLILPLALEPLYIEEGDRE